MARGLPESGQGERGMILIFSVIAVLLIAGLSAAFLSLSLHGGRAAMAQVTNSRAFYVAESALDEAVLRITHQFYTTTYDPSSVSSRFSALDAIDTPDDGNETVFEDRATGARFQDFVVGPGTATVWVESNAATPRDQWGEPSGMARDLKVISSGKVDGTTCSIQKNLRYLAQNTHKFDFGLLAEELPGCMFCHLQVRGDVGQTGAGPFSLWSPYDRSGFSRSAVYGDLYLKGAYSAASAETNGPSGGLGQERMVTDQGGAIQQSYSGEKLAEWGSIRQSFATDGWFDSLSRSQNASISLNHAPAVTLSGALDSSKPKAFMAAVGRPGVLTPLTPSLRQVGPVVDGHLVLIGTPHNPLVLNKSITVHGDVVIKGTVSGIGNINASGNIFIVDSLTYANPPANLQDAKGGVDGGGEADKLGLISGSNTLIGDLTDQKTAQFVNVQFVEAQGSGYEYVPARYLNNHFALDGNRDLASRAVGGHSVSTPGLLPEGALAGVYNPLFGISYVGGWMPYGLLNSLSSPGLSRIDATLFADYAIAGGQHAATALITLLGGAVGNEIGILSARGGSPSAFTIYYDNRNARGNPLGFPMEPSVIETGWFRIPPKLPGAAP